MTSDEFDKTNWVERRALIEQTLRRDAPGFWEQIRSALQDACKSFKKHYPQLARDIECKLENGMRALFTRFDPDENRRQSIVVTYDADARQIEVAHDEYREEFEINYGRDGMFVESTKDRFLSPDKLSEHILKPFLFPERK